MEFGKVHTEFTYRSTFLKPRPVEYRALDRHTLLQPRRNTDLQALFPRGGDATAKTQCREEPCAVNRHLGEVSVVLRTYGDAAAYITAKGPRTAENKESNK